MLNWKYLERSLYGLIAALSMYLLRGAEEYHERPQAGLEPRSPRWEAAD
jgi:hypothetical protein